MFGFYPCIPEVGCIHEDHRLVVRRTRAVIARKQPEDSLDDGIRTPGRSAKWVSVMSSGPVDFHRAIRIARESTPTRDSSPG